MGLAQIVVDVLAAPRLFGDGRDLFGEVVDRAGVHAALDPPHVRQPLAGHARVPDPLDVGEGNADGRHFGIDLEFDTAPGVFLDLDAAARPVVGHDDLVVKAFYLVLAPDGNGEKPGQQRAEQPQPRVAWTNVPHDPRILIGQAWHRYPPAWPASAVLRLRPSRPGRRLSSGRRRAGSGRVHSF